MRFVSAVGFAVATIPWAVACSDAESQVVSPNGTCDPNAAFNVEVRAADREGFPPYAAFGCTLVYVNAVGALVQRDLGTGEELTLAGEGDHPRRPATSAKVIAWEADERGRSVVRVRTGGATRTVRGAFIAAGEPRASGNHVVFTAWNGPLVSDDTDVWIYDADALRAHMVLGGKGQQRLADISSDFVVATDFDEDVDGRFDDNEFDVADLVAFDRRTGAISHRRSPGKQAFPLLADGGVLAYLDWAAIHPEPKLVGFGLRSGAVLGDPASDRTLDNVAYASGESVRPTVVGRSVEWVASGSVLFRAPLDGSSPPAAADGLAGLELYAPVSTTTSAGAGFTILAGRPRGLATALPRLRVVAR